MFVNSEQIALARARLKSEGYCDEDIDFAGNWIMEHPRDYPDPNLIYEYLKKTIDSEPYEDELEGRAEK